MVRISITRLATRIVKSKLYKVEGDSMSPSFEHGERLLVSRAAYDCATPDRGDAVIARDPKNPSLHYLKRIIGLPLEEVRLFDGMPAYVGLDDKTWKLGERDYFVLGDNRAHSTDSRDFGPIDAKLILGKARFRFWPRQRWGVV